MRFILALIVLAALGVLAFLNRDKIERLWHKPGAEHANVSAGGAPGPQGSQALADSAALKLQALESGKYNSIAFTDLELESLLQYKYRALLPTFVDSPHVQLIRDHIQVSGRVPTDRLPTLKDLGPAAEFLPDTTELSVNGELLPLRPGRIALVVNSVRISHIPLPGRMVPSALTRLGRLDEPGLPPNAMSLKLPPGAYVAYVRNDSLFFLRK